MYAISQVYTLPAYGPTLVVAVQMLLNAINYGKGMSVNVAVIRLKLCAAVACRRMR